MRFRILIVLAGLLLGTACVKRPGIDPKSESSTNNVSMQAVSEKAALPDSSADEDLEAEALIKSKEFDEISPFQNGYAEVKKNGLYGLLKENGELALEPLFDYIVLNDKKPRAAFKKGGKWGYWKDGKIIYEPKYENLRLGFSPEHGYDLYEVNGLCGLLYEDGTVAIPAQFKAIHGFAGSTPLSYVILADGRNAYIDLKGKVQFYVRGEGTYYRDNLAVVYTYYNHLLDLRAVELLFDTTNHFYRYDVINQKGDILYSSEFTLFYPGIAPEHPVEKILRVTGKAPIFDVKNVPRQQVDPNDYYTRTSMGYVKTTGAEMISNVVELTGDLKMDFVNQAGEIEKSGVPYSEYLNKYQTT